MNSLNKPSSSILMFEGFYKSPIGYLHVQSSEKGITKIHFLDTEPDVSNQSVNPHIEQSFQELEAYFSKDLKIFTMPLDLGTNVFREKVWSILLEIPFGKSISYSEQAKTYGDTMAIRAIAAANGQNPIAIVVPCHRVIGKSGALTGYAGGLWRKEWLLKHEGILRQESLFL